MADVGIAEFLEARWAEREAAARAAGYGAAGDYLWQEVDPDRMPGLIGTGCGDVVTFNGGTPAYAVSPSRGQATHIALNDPASVLADIEAKRAILEMWQDPAAVRDLSLHPGADPEHPPQDGRDPDEIEAQVAAAEAIDDVVRLLTAPFAAHPDYRQEWKP